MPDQPAKPVAPVAAPDPPKPVAEEPKPKRYRALTDLSLRQSSDPEDELYEKWHNWKAGATFTPPDHMNIDGCLIRGIVEEVV